MLAASLPLLVPLSQGSYTTHVKHPNIYLINQENFVRVYQTHLGKKIETERSKQASCLASLEWNKHHTHIPPLKSKVIGGVDINLLATHAMKSSKMDVMSWSDWFCVTLQLHAFSPWPCSINLMDMKIATSSIPLASTISPTWKLGCWKNGLPQYAKALCCGRCQDLCSSLTNAFIQTFVSLQGPIQLEP